MLNTKTKNAIDKCRQVLVGKIPSPEGQIEQITMAMLYKFMDDMDNESIALGGVPKFFVGDYEQFSWRKIMSDTIGAQERYNLYTDALEKFYVHPTMDIMFREMFKNATFPVKEAEFLTLFLREIDAGFDYSDSETLGDAYEYLLSDQASQKTLGQFRTPRHIINFIVDIVKPQKNETILDPACGTAGFLISAYNYILNDNKNVKPGDKLNYDEKVELLSHLSGYDTEPKMVKIAQMNMFLHGAKSPDIFEYDTLVNDSKWEEKFNVILANPPFMTPKGGIKPHKHFNLKAKKAEILFLDFMMTHLRKEGRMGVVVPEGIIANTTGAYLSLRKEMLENGLYAVVSLHSYVFEPYTNVSTLLLFLDKKFSNRKELYIASIENDGFEKNSIRNEIKENDMPEILKDIEKFKKYLIDGNKPELKMGKVITEAEYGDELDFHPNSYLWEENESMKTIDSLFNVEKGELQSSKREDGEYDFITASDEWGKHNTYTHETEALIFVFGAGGSLGKVHYVNGKFIASDLCYILTPKPNVKIDLKYYYAYFRKHRKTIVKLLARGVNKKAINITRFQKFKVECPDYPIQVEYGKKVEEKMQEIQQLKDEINNKQNEIDNIL